MFVHERKDRELLAEFAATRAEAPFAELVRRHGPEVLGVCRRVLGSEHDAEDAAQAVFLTLAQKAGVLRGVRSLGGWLHHVACCVARDARKAAERRQRYEQAAARAASHRADLTVDEDRLHAIVDEALDDLPERYRLPILLHHYEGRSHEESAALLGCRPSTFSGRLTRGRELLKDRLVRSGQVFSVGVLAALLSREALAAELPATFSGTVAQAAGLLAAGHAAAGAVTGLVSAQVAALTKGALQMLFIAKLKTAALVAAAVIALGSGTGFVAYRAWAAENPSAVLINDDLQRQVLRKDRELLETKDEKQSDAGVAGRSSAPAVKDGLAVTVTLAKVIFEEQEPLAFSVSFKNVSEKEFILYDYNDVWSWKREFFNLQLNGPWRWEIKPGLKIERQRMQPISKAVPAGTGVEVPVKLDQQNEGDFFLYVWHGEQAKTVHPRKHLPPGQYQISVSLKLDRNPAPQKDAFPHWIGEIATNPVEFEIIAAKPIESSLETRANNPANAITSNAIDEVKGKARAAAHLAASAGTLSQLGQACQMYDDEHDRSARNFPADPTLLLTQGYMTSPDVFLNPRFPNQDVGYVYVTGNSENPLHVRAFENIPDEARDKGGNALYDDGHVEFISGESWNKWLAKLQEEVKASNGTMKFMPINYQDLKKDVKVPAAPKEETNAPKTSEAGTAAQWNKPLPLKLGTGPLAFAPDGKRLAVARGNWGLKQHDATGKEVPVPGNWEMLLFDTTGRQAGHFAGHQGRAIRDLEFSYDGTLLVSCGYDYMVRVWDVSSQKQTHAWQGYPSGISLTGVVFLNNGTLVAAVHSSGEGGVWSLDDVKNSPLSAPLPKWTFKGCMLAASPNGKQLQVSERGSVKIYDAESGGLARSVLIPELEARGVVFSRDGKWAASGVGGYDSPARIWDLESGKERFKLPIMVNSSSVLAFSPDGSILVTLDSDFDIVCGPIVCGPGKMPPPPRFVQVWSVETGKERFKKLAEGATSIAFAPDGTLAIGGPDGVNFWNAQTGAALGK